MDAQQSSRGRQPDHYMYHVSEGKEGKSFFTKIGSGWDNKDGEGISWIWELQPNGKTVSRTRAASEAHHHR